MNSNHDRVTNEREIWDHQKLQRVRYDADLAHANYGPARARRDRFIGKAVADLGDTQRIFVTERSGQGTLRAHNPLIGLKKQRAAKGK
jgi:hypothetical protein